MRFNEDFDSEIRPQIEKAFDEYIAGRLQGNKITCDFDFDPDEISSNTLKMIFAQDKPLDYFYNEFLNEEIANTEGYDLEYLIENELNLDEDIKQDYFTEILEIAYEKLDISIDKHDFNKPIYIDIYPIFENDTESLINMIRERIDEETTHGEVATVNKNLVFLIESQGRSVDDFIKYFEDSFNENEGQPLETNNFFDSIISEINNYTQYPEDFGQVVFLAQAPLLDLLEAMQEKKNIIIPSSATCGIVNTYNGSGGTLDITLEKNIEVNTSNLDINYYHGYNYNVDEIYGLVSSAWENEIGI